jgi:hypothetical protein
VSTLHAGVAVEVRLGRGGDVCAVLNFGNFFPFHKVKMKVSEFLLTLPSLRTRPGYTS